MELDDPNALPEGAHDHINIEDEMSSSFIDYSMSVIISRALPDARDGLKPVHRRVLYAMDELGCGHSKAFKKCARIVGETMGKYHPHGDQAIYDALVRLGQDFSMRYTLVEGQGNFGSIDGDPPGAQRYTEARLNRLSEEMLEDLNKDTVDFVPNYDESETQPSVLPAKLPNLLLNGSTGIAVGMATNIPPHNLRELVDGITHLIDNPECSIDDLMGFIKGPDFPTAATICGVKGIEAMYRTGRGQMMVRGRAEITEEKKREVILITEIPYMVNKENMVKTIADLVKTGVIEGISDIRDESDDNIRVVIELKRGAMGQVVLNNLYKHTQLQQTFGAIMLAIHQGRPKIMNLKDMLLCWLRHRFEVITRRTRFELNKAEARRHIVEGLLKALDHLDEIVRLIRAAPNRDAAHAELLARFGFSDRQADAILEMRLYQLTGLERSKLESELAELLQRIEYLNGLLAFPERIYAIIKEDLATLREKYGDERRTELVPLEGEVSMEDLIADAPCILTLSHKGYIKRVPLDTYREQNRGGRGVTGAATKEEDFIETLFVAETHDTILFFTTLGRVYATRAFDIPEAGRTSPGKALVNVLDLREGEKAAAMLRIRKFHDDQFVFFASERGIVKKTRLSDYRNVRGNGIIALNIEEGDHLVGVRLTSGSDQIILATAHGMAIRFPEQQVRPTGRGATGVWGIDLEPGDTIRGFDIVREDLTFLIATANGYGKRSAFDDFRVQSRGGKGIIGIKASERNGEVVAAATVSDEDSLIMVTAQGMMVRSPLGQVRVIGRNTQGVRLINLDEGDELVSASVIHPEEDSPDTADNDDHVEKNNPVDVVDGVAVVESPLTTPEKEPLQ